MYKTGVHKSKMRDLEGEPVSPSSGFERAPPQRATMEDNKFHDPLHNIPPEIVSSIFRFSGDSEPEKDHDYPIPNTTTLLEESLRRCRWPLELSSVCARWRSIALRDPRLWTTIATYRPGETWTLPFELVEQRVSRCGALPLQLALWWETETQTVDENFVSLIKFLCTQSARWTSLLLRIPSHAIPVFKHNAKVTLDLDLFHIDITDAPDLDHCWNMEDAVIYPRNVSLMGLARLPRSLNWRNLVTLCIKGIRVCDLLPIISTCKGIKSLDLSLLRTRPSDINQELLPEVFSLPHLASLAVVFATPVDLNFLMAFTRLPALRFLVIFYVRDGEQYFDTGILQTALARSSKTLHSLYFQNILFESDKLLSLLNCFAHLQVLRIVNTDKVLTTTTRPWLDALFERLTTTLSDALRTTFLPRLFYFDYIGPKAFSWSAVANTLEAHIKSQIHPDSLRPGRLLMHFNIELPPSTEQENYEYIEKEILLRFLGLSPHWMDISIDEKLIRASLEHHGIETSSHPIFRSFKDFDEFIRVLGKCSSKKITSG